MNMGGYEFTHLACRLILPPMVAWSSERVACLWLVPTFCTDITTSNGAQQSLLVLIKTIMSTMCDLSVEYDIQHPFKEKQKLFSVLSLDRGSRANQMVLVIGDRF